MLATCSRLFANDLGENRPQPESYESDTLPLDGLQFLISSLLLAYSNKKLSYCWETVRRESMPRIAEMDVEMTTSAE